MCALFPLIYRRVTRYLDTDDDSSIRKLASDARLKPWGLNLRPFLNAIGIRQTRDCLFPDIF